VIVEQVDRDGKFAFKLERTEFEMGADRQFFDEIKRHIPGQCRQYNPKVKVWIVDALYQAFVLQRLKYHFVAPVDPTADIPLCEVGTLSRFFKRRPRRKRVAA
jgi:hypothetical protein